MKIRRKKLEDDIEIQWDYKGPEVSDKAVQCDLSDDSDYEEYLSSTSKLCKDNSAKLHDSLSAKASDIHNSDFSFEFDSFVYDPSESFHSTSMKCDSKTSKVLTSSKREDLNFESNLNKEVDNEIMIIDDFPFENKKSNNIKTGRGKKRNEFILSQAEDVDGSTSDEDENSENDHNTSMDCFIVGDDEEEEDSDVVPVDDDDDADLQPLPQPTKKRGTDLQIYLKSLADKVGRPEHHKFKLKYDYDRSVNVYSQAVVHDESDDYQNDSFCTEEIIVESSDESIVEFNTQSMKLRSKRTLPRKTSTPNRPPIKKRKRIILQRMLDDDEDEE